MNSVTKRTSMLQRFKLPLLAMLMCGLLSLACSPALAASSTTTILTATPTSISAGAIVTLTASVASGNTPLNAGQVEFCNAAAAHLRRWSLAGFRLGYHQRHGNSAAGAPGRHYEHQGRLSGHKFVLKQREHCPVGICNRSAIDEPRAGVPRRRDDRAVVHCRRLQ